MSYSSAPSYGFFPTAASTAPSPFSIFSFSHSPRETHAMIEDLRDALSPSSQASESDAESEKNVRRASSSSLRDSIRRIFRL
ncbi:hypothetical protein PsYK624_001700 [Phanerochaete sordida]|uniref:Uncharacterized protein n=1 Tax=Phanerochaete sordida TaxID=48140 RepID=A0A9P3FXC5_9APHY|nr:hypothetical protein PsYK624_001700 [Phanerochaete sordida]